MSNYVSNRILYLNAAVVIPDYFCVMELTKHNYIPSKHAGAHSFDRRWPLLTGTTKRRACALLTNLRRYRLRCKLHHVSPQDGNNRISGQQSEEGVWWGVSPARPARPSIGKGTELPFVYSLVLLYTFFLITCSCSVLINARLNQYLHSFNTRSLL